MTDEFSVESVYAELLGRAPENKMEPRLAPLFRAMDVLGEPNKAFPIIHVTGTNGKTSTARMIESVLRAHGLSTGRYTSPHLSKVTERISIDGHPVPDETFVRIWDEIRPYLQIVDSELEAAGEPRLTYFECLTILGFAIFADQPVNVAVIEVGLGGITDATNVGDGQVSVITPISLDHTDLLGETTEDIAYEKAGIIKPGGYLISAAQPLDAAQVLLDKAKDVGVPFRFEGVEFGVESRTVAVGGQVVSIQGIAGRYPELLVPLHGAHQAQNAAVAVAALEAFFGGEKELDFEVLQEGFSNVTSPGRLEVVRTAPTIVVDAAHNPDGIKASAAALQEAFTFTRLVPVVGVLKEKDAEEILRQLKESLGGMAEEYCFTQSNSPRAVPAAELAELAIELGFGEDNVHIAEKLDDALEWAVERAEANDDLSGGVLVTGSITLVAEARILLGKTEA
ncbi:folylpolyglutamate synthase/dihydrofolate synthase family protein [Arthrobacter sp. KFRI-F3372]|uniref:bifunctional folylpolyglutamate synthase/dihydrofolate synthase n=1 Tax=Pseudarthrobacter TaxID=1742993 RepID=UPI001573E127|nr:MULTISPECIES: folylpolyglutamate synthase/dihydrofolate synthase family protein [Pseudarthrobacter]MBA4102525.1 dihydrofolate synthase [Arthrobacter sp.]MDV2979501.1 folylpolyglutamate synthase/dihydrofolate synthase family protein [Actinomycetes bacterium ARC8]WHP57719.1 folylpolyglutamate synthase/dihydrofolate synthase family protein [Arthrobacter sp. KFRI-F3372]NSX37783.1 bifunctional folylpolyglutamate synthase/dihydrofolate synthase [Pseudarthrobacter oxydans]BFE45788.1 folylpolygluta